MGRKILLDQLTGRARTRSELAGKLAGPYPKSPVEETAVTPGWEYGAAADSTPVVSMRP